MSTLFSGSRSLKIHGLFLVHYRKHPFSPHIWDLLLILQWAQVFSFSIILTNRGKDTQNTVSEGEGLILSSLVENNQAGWVGLLLKTDPFQRAAHELTKLMIKYKTWKHQIKIMLPMSLCKFRTDFTFTFLLWACISNMHSCYIKISQFF